jgi:1,4-alpha-glucan branching enzyme
VPAAGTWREIMNTDAGVYGGSNLGNGGWVTAEDQSWGDFPASVSLTLPPLATVILEAV